MRSESDPSPAAAPRSAACGDLSPAGRGGFGATRHGWGRFAVLQPPHLSPLGRGRHDALIVAGEGSSTFGVPTHALPLPPLPPAVRCRTPLLCRRALGKGHPPCGHLLRVVRRR